VLGDNFLSWKAKRPARVLYVESEIPEHQMQERLRQVVGKSNGNLRIVTLDEQPDNEIPSLLTEYGRKLVEEAIGEAEVLVLDSISTLFNFATNEEEPWLEVMAWLKKLRSKGLCVLFLHHAGKSGVQRGSSKSEDLLDVSIKLAQPVDYRIEEGLRANLTFDKTRGVAMIDGEVQVAMTIEDDVAVFPSGPIDDGKNPKSGEYDRAKQYLDTYPDATVRELEEKSKKSISKSSFQRYRQRWRAEKARKKSPEEAAKNPWRAVSNDSELAPREGDRPKDESKPFRFIGAGDQQKKPPMPEMSPMAKLILEEGDERDKERA
jgi:AAA domain